MATSLLSSSAELHVLGAATQRLLWLVIALAALGSVVLAVGLQHLEGLDPCPLCIVQRYQHLIIGTLALGAAFTRGRLSFALGVLTLLAALSGAAVGSHHVWMAQNPIMASCSRWLFELVNNARPAQWLPALFRGGGDCLANDWAAFGLSMPAWSLVFFCGYLIAAWPALVMAWSPRSSVRSAG
ncbi:MAG: disulfide bond formation protein B [Burkholderiales bacterium]|nr:disulfide bond formation protein B [Burkholderiales bacterium]